MDIDTTNDTENTSGKGVASSDWLNIFTRREKVALECIRQEGKVISEMSEQQLLKYRGCGKAWIRKLREIGMIKTPPSNEEIQEEKRKQRINHLETIIAKKLKEVVKNEVELQLLKFNS